MPMKLFPTNLSAPDPVPEWKVGDMIYPYRAATYPNLALLLEFKCLGPRPIPEQMTFGTRDPRFYGTSWMVYEAKLLRSDGTIFVDHDFEPLEWQKYDFRS